MKLTLNNLKIESNVPIPERHNGRGWKELISKLKVGDSVVVPLPHAKFASSLTPVKRSLNVKLVLRTVDGGTRIWRTE